MVSKPSTEDDKQPDLRGPSTLLDAMPRPKRNHHTYNEGGLSSVHNWDFVDDPAYIRAFVRSAELGGQFPKWRLHTGLWAAAHAANVPGDFVECGVNHGMMARAILEYLPWHEMTRRFYLMDTWAGIDERFITDEERALGYADNNAKMIASGTYRTDVEALKQSFVEWERITFIQGAIPETLEQATTTEVALLHVDMNCAPPEVAACVYFWPKLVPGGIVLFDDYAYYKHTPQKTALDSWADSVGVQILSVPTGQGLLIKPPAQR